MQQITKALFSVEKEHLACRIKLYLQPPKYLIIIANQSRFINNNITKDRCAIHTDMSIVLGPRKFRLKATIALHGPSMYSCHYTTSVNCFKTPYITTTAKLLGLNFFIPKKLLYCICCNVWIDFQIGFELKQGDRSLIIAMELAYFLQPIRSRSRNKRQFLWVGRCVSSWWTCFWSINSSHYIYLSWITDASWLIGNKLFLRDIYILGFGVAMTLCRMIRYWYSLLLVFNCVFQFYS